MKKKVLIIGSLVVVVIALLFVVKPWGSKPFNDLTMNEIVSVSVELMPPDKTYDLDQNQISDLLNISQNIVIFNKVPLEPLAGQAVLFTITKTDGTTTKIISMGGDLLEIDGVRYKTKTEPNRELRELGTEISEGK